MFRKIAGYSLVGMLAVALVAGSVYILLRPAEVQAGQGPLGRQAEVGYRGDGRGTLDWSASGRGGTAQGQGAGGPGNSGRAYGRGQGFGGGASGSDGTGLDHPVDTWVPAAGIVVSLDDDLILQTGEGQMAVNLGPAWYLDGQGFVLNAGDEVVVSGFYDGSTFEAGQVENLTTGETLTLRDDLGRPLWAGRGRWGQ